MGLHLSIHHFLSNIKGFKSINHLSPQLPVLDSLQLGRSWLVGEVVEWLVGSWLKENKPTRFG